MATMDLLELADHITTRNADLLSSDGCAAALDGVLSAAAASGARCLAGATSAGHAICGAAVVRSNGRLRLWRSGDAGPVLVVDGVTASRIAVQVVQRRLEHRGLATFAHVIGLVQPVESSAKCPGSEDAGLFTEHDRWRRAETVA